MATNNRSQAFRIIPFHNYPDNCRITKTTDSVGIVSRMCSSSHKKTIGKKDYK